MDHPAVDALVAAHQRCLDAAANCSEGRRLTATAVAFAVVAEVASLLQGSGPTGPAEVGYVAARTAALEELATALTAGADDAAAREHGQAIVEARAELERLDGRSALADATALTAELHGMS